MQHFRRGRRSRVFASIACLAFVLQGLVPSLAHALASVSRAQHYPGELCSADPRGAHVRLSRALDAEAPTPARPLPVAAHCPFCALPGAADAPALAPFVGDAPRVPAARSVPIVLSEAHPPRPAQQRPQAARAPPRS